MKRVLIAAMLFLAVAAHAETIPIGDYIAELERLQSLLATNQLRLANDEAKRFAMFDVDSPRGRFHADVSLLDGIANAHRADLELRARLAVTIDELRRAVPNAGAPVDPALLRRVASEQEVPELAAGGDLPIVPRTTPLMERIAQSLANAWEWALEKLARVLDWLLDFLPKSVRRPGATGGMRWIVSGIVAVIVLLIVYLAFAALRRARRGSAQAIETSEPLGSKRDEDPLSRGASEWERYAAQLAQAERFREAIRAWYHAALVSCYAAGVLHFRKSRTNWEYVATLAPSYEWRPEFIALTRRFEREWYGAEESNADAYDDCRRRARVVIDAVRVAMRGAA
jgi:hypothetical protein